MVKSKRAERSEEREGQFEIEGGAEELAFREREKIEGRGAEREIERECVR